MADLETFFRNRLPPRLSDEGLKRYAREHLRRLDAGGSSYRKASADTRALFNAYFGMALHDNVLATVSKGSTLAKNRALEALIESVSRYEGAIRVKWSRSSAEYFRFYPRGITDFRKATLETIEDRLSVYEQALEELGDQLPEDVVQAFLAPIDPDVPESGGTIVRFREARSAQVNLQEATGDRRDEAAQKRRALEWQLTKNMHIVAIAIAGKSEERSAAMRLFPTHLLGSIRRKRKSKDKPKDGAKPVKKTTSGNGNQEAAKTETTAPARDAGTTAPVATENTSAAAGNDSSVQLPN